MGLHGPPPLLLKWSDWKPLSEAVADGTIPSGRGIYRVSFSRTSGLEYLGYGDLRERAYRLNLGIQSSEMPYRDPHMAAPCLWALNDSLEGKYWISWVSEPSAADGELEGKKAALIAQYRQATGQSPTANFGRMPEDYSASSYHTGGRRGKRTGEPVSGSLYGNAQQSWTKWDQFCSERWMGYSWSSFEPLVPDWSSLGSIKDDLPLESGLFRVRKVDAETLSQIGQASNLRKSIFRLRELHKGENLEISWAIEEFTDTHHAYEAESDLVGVHYLAERVTAESDDFLESSGVVFVEGRSDKSIFEILSMKMDKPLHESSIELVPRGEPGETEQEIIDVLDRIEIPYLFVLDGHGDDPREREKELRRELKVSPNRIRVLSKYGIESYLKDVPEAVAEAFNLDEGDAADFIERNSTDGNEKGALKDLFESNYGQSYNKEHHGAMIALQIEAERIPSELKDTIDEMIGLAGG